MKYLALGDSYTIGEAVEQTLTFPFQLTKSLSALGITFKEPLVIAKTGWTTDELDSAIDQTSFTPPYQLVTLLIGVNNQYRGRSAENFQEEFKNLLDKALKFAGYIKTNVFVLSIPDWSVTPFGVNSDKDVLQIAAEIDAYNKIIERTCEEALISFTDITPLSRLAKTDASLNAQDGLHPSGKQYEEWVNLLAPKVFQALKTSTID